VAAFLEVITRTMPGRADLLANNVASLEAQTDGDWQQLIIRDEVGRGVGWAQEQIAEHAPALYGRYIWILDDDDMCTLTTLVAELKHIVKYHDPDVIMLRMDHGSRGILPPAGWRGMPVCGRIGCSAYVVRRETFQKHAGAFRSARYQSDYDFALALWDSGLRIYWHEAIASRVQQIGYEVGA
jgi:hypothetical protein